MPLRAEWNDFVGHNMEIPDVKASVPQRV